MIRKIIEKNDANRLSDNEKNCTFAQIYIVKLSLLTI